MWTRKDYEVAAQKIGEDFAASGGQKTINDLSLKVAQDAALNPEGIRTVVRLANVTAFEKFFEKGAADGAPDRMIEFSIGDPEVIISQLHQDAKTAYVQEKTASNYNRTLDYHADFKYDQPPMEKTAFGDPVHMGVSAAFKGTELAQNLLKKKKKKKKKKVSKKEAAFLFKRAEDKMKEEQRQAQRNWMISLEKAASLLVATDSRISAREMFEKNAASLLGEDIIPELNMVHTLTSPKNTEVNLFGGVKIANVLDTHIASISHAQRPIIGLLKEANAARKLSNTKEAGLKWITDNVPK